MYDQYFDDGVADLDVDETIERAYALGVASVCGAPADGEYERLKAASPDAYDETIVELAFEEGRAKAMDLEAENESGEEIWETLVESAFESPRLTAEGVPGGLPDALTRGPGDVVTDGLPSSLDRPSFLER